MIAPEILLLAAAVLQVTPVQLPVQDSFRFLPGITLRVTAPSAGASRLVGRVTTVDTASRAISIVGAHRGEKKHGVSIPLAAMTQLEVRTVTSTKVGGAVVGLLLGAAVGAILGSAVGEECTGGIGGPCFDKASTSSRGALLFGAIGGFVGYRIAPGDRWDTVPLHAGF